VQEWYLPWPDNGVYTALARHKNYSGVLSDVTAVLEFEVEDGVLLGVSRHWVTSTNETAEWQIYVDDGEDGLPIYEPACWYGPGGSLLINTPNIEVDAVDEMVFTDLSDTVVTWTNSSGVNNVRFDFPSLISWSNSTPRPVKVELSGEVGGTRVSGTGDTYVQIFKSLMPLVAGLSPGSVGPQRYLSTSTGYARSAFVDQVELDVGETVYLGLASIFQAADGTTTDQRVDGRLRITALKA
jgi:hypothetical protein